MEIKFNADILTDLHDETIEGFKKSYSPVFIYRGVKIYENVTDRILFGQGFARYMPITNMIEFGSTPVQRPGLDIIKIYPKQLFATLPSSIKNEFVVSQEIYSVKAEIDKFYLERESSLNLSSTEFFIEVYGDGGELQIFPVGQSFADLDAFLHPKSKAQIERLRGLRINEHRQFRIRQYWNSDIGRIGHEQIISMDAYESMPENKRNEILLDMMADRVRAHYLKELSVKSIK
jgi:hypothetical protein